mgnify:FL=1
MNSSTTAGGVSVRAAEPVVSSFREGETVTRLVSWMQTSERRLFAWMNRGVLRRRADALFRAVTCLGAAPATVLPALGFALFAPPPLSAAGNAALIALAASHLPVAVLKRLCRRRRPYLVWPDALACRNPLRDPSFPSGHTAAAFSVAVPFALAVPPAVVALLPIALAVGISRIVLGLHYPSDVLVGALLGTVAGIAAFGLIG